MTSYSYLWGPVSAFAVIAFFVLILRWAYSDRPDSLLARRTRSGKDGEYGLLTAIAAPASCAEGERLRGLLGLAGVKGTLTRTDVGLRIFVFPTDACRARELLTEAGEQGIPPRT